MINDVIMIAKSAGQIIREGFGKNFSVEYKTNKSNLVTEIDKKSEAHITDFIEKHYPSHGIIAEEGSAKRGTSEYAWVIDPLDGTTNFAHGLPIFSVSIGVIKETETICGVVYDVMNDVIYSAEKGCGAFCNMKKIEVSKNEDLEQSLLVTGFPYDIKKNPSHAIERFNAFLTESRAVRRLGSAAIDFCYVAKGVFDGFWEVHLNPWDICAGKLIVEEAGGIVTDFYGKEIDIFSKQILASNKLVHSRMMDILNRFE